MKKYRFGLTRLLELRRLEADLVRAKFEKRLAEVRRQEDMRSEIARQVTEAGRAALREGAPGVERAGAGNFRQYAKRADEAVVQEQRKAVAAAEQARRELVEAERRVRALEMLDERGRATWRRELDREVEQFAAEAYLARWRPQRPAEAISD